MSSRRRLAREWALQILFGLDYGNKLEPEVFERFWASTEEATPSMKSYTEDCVKGVVRERRALDASIERYAENWSLDRMARVDLNVMRIALYELMHRDDIPAAVSINEAVDIVRDFGSNESGKFVNAILDRAKRELDVSATDSKDA